ncbi:endonuclease domain-containing protein [Brachybacterium huguangmaarense]
MTWTPPLGTVWTREELLSRGVHPRVLASSEYVRVLPGRYALSAVQVPLAVLAGCLAREVLPGAVVSHATAAELLGWPLPRRVRLESTGVLHCRLPAGDGRRAGPTVRVHRREPRRMRRVGGVPVAGVAETLCDLAPSLTHDELVVCMDHIVGPAGSGFVASVDELSRLLADADGLQGVKKVRAALPDVREKVESPQETALRLALARFGFPEPTINLPIWAPGCRSPYRLDLSYPDLRIAIEYDGDWHRTDRVRFQRDRRKDDVLHEYGWRVVRVTSADLARPDELIARLEHLGVPRAVRASRAARSSRAAGTRRSA